MDGVKGENGLLTFFRQGAVQHAVIVFAVVFRITHGRAAIVHEHRSCLEGFTLLKRSLGLLQTAQPEVILGGECEIANTVQDLEEPVSSSIILNISWCFGIVHLLQTVYCLQNDDFIEAVIDLQASVR